MKMKFVLSSSKLITWLLIAVTMFTFLSFINTPIVRAQDAVVCTRTYDYWKTHSIYGPRSYDPVWANVGEETLFYTSGKTFYEVMWTPPQKGNVYYKLAHAFITATLNDWAGASITDYGESVEVAYYSAMWQFENSTPEDVAVYKGKDGKVEREVIMDWTRRLDEFNKGIVGPGKCD